MILLADIGGTHIRYCFWDKGKLTSLKKENCDDFKTPLEILDKIYKQFKFTSAFLAVAGPVEKGKVLWTNRPKWSLSQEMIKTRYHLKRAVLLNDLEAQAHGLKIKLDKRSLLMNVGTGFGSCFIDQGKIIPCEFGLTLDETDHKKEFFLSGSGIVEFYHRLGGDKKIISAKEIDLRRQKKDKMAQKAYQLFYQLWGKTAANIATGLRINGSLFLWGGLVPKNKKDMDDFLINFKNKKYPKFTHKIPIKIVKNKALTIKGLTNLLKAESVES